MPKLKENYCLKKHNTFGIEAKTKLFIEFNSSNELRNILSSAVYKKNKSFVLGEGSNILITKDFNGLILHNKIMGIMPIKEDENFVTIEVGSGENWNNFVEWSVNQDLSGIENLALIPGTVGASPIQNIGAYGMEVKDSITKVHTLKIEDGTLNVFSNEECKFEYRESIFKKILKEKFIITTVEFKLSKKAINNTSYGDINKELEKLNLKPSPRNIADAVINIRNRKLPNPSELANSGSFFKNPIISKQKFESLKIDFPEIVGHQISQQEIKIAAGWLIENSGMKGYREGDAGVHKNQALVLVNYAKAKGEEILNLANKIQNIILEKYGVRIEPEVNIL